MKKLRFEFDIDRFDNPVLQTHYAALEAMALERDNIEPIHDYTSKSHSTCPLPRGLFPVSKVTKSW